MKRIFGNKVILVIILVVLLALGTLVVSAFSGGRSTPGEDAAGSILSPVQQAFGGLFDWLGSIYGYMYDYDSLKAENESLRRRIAEMEAASRESIQANEENARLRKLLELREKRRDFVLESADIVARDPSNWSSAFTIAKGSVHGIEPFACVITEEGFLVGYISEVGANWAIVTTLADTDMECGAYIFRTGEAAVAEGDFSLMREGLLKLTFLPRGSDIFDGDLVLTSGSGGIFPKDLVIGKVREVRTEVTGISSYAILTPEVDLDRLTQIFIVKSFDIAE